METIDRKRPDASNPDIVKADLHQEALLNPPKLWDGSDETIAENVREALAHHRISDKHPLKTTSLRVSVVSGVVHLSGWVPDGESKREAYRCVRDLPGVKEVKNELTAERTWWDRARSAFKFGHHSAE